MSSKNLKRQRLITFIFVNMMHYPCTLKSNIYHSNNRGPPPIFHPDTNPVIRHALIHSVDRIHVLVVTVELILLLFLNMLSFNFVSTPRKSLRFIRFRRSYVNHPVVILTNHCQRYTVFFFAWCTLPKVAMFLFLQPNDRAVAFLSTPVVQMLLTPKWLAGKQM